MDGRPLIAKFRFRNECVAIGKPERQMRKASHCGSKQQ